MGVKGLKKVIAGALSDTMIGSTSDEVLCIDMLGLLFACSHGLLVKSAEEDQSDKTTSINGYVLNNQFRLNIEAVCERILKHVSRIGTRFKTIKLCVDGDKRPAMKQMELDRRKLRTDSSDRANFLKRTMQYHKHEFVHALRDLLLHKQHDVQVITAAYEADCVVIDGTIVVTTDTDILMFTLFTDRVKYVSFLESGGKLRFLSISAFKMMYGIDRILWYSLIGGNDYLPSIYCPACPNTLYQKTACSFFTSFENILKSVRNHNKVYRDKSQVQPIVRMWLAALARYVAYLKTRNPEIIDVSMDIWDIKKCDIFTVQRCLNDLPMQERLFFDELPCVNV